MNVTLEPGFRALVEPRPAAPTRAQVERLEGFLRQLEQVDLGTTHTLSGSVYVRCIFIPAGAALTGAVHKTDHVNIVHGDITVSTDDGMQRISGFRILPTRAGRKRVGIAHEDTYWATCCTTGETELEAIENELVEDAHRLQTRQALLAGTELKKLEG
jgi:hypothetical protein